MRFALACLFLVGCEASLRMADWRRPGLPFGTVSQDLLDDMIQKGDAASARGGGEALDDALDNWRGALRYRPDDVSLLVRLSRGYRVRAQTLKRSDADPKRLQAIAFAEHALAQRNWELCQRAQAKKPPQEIFAAAEPADLPALEAYLQAIYEWSTAHNDATIVKERDNIRAAADRLLALDPRSRPLVEQIRERVARAKQSWLVSGTN